MERKFFTGCLPLPPMLLGHLYLLYMRDTTPIIGFTVFFFFSRGGSCWKQKPRSHIYRESTLISELQLDCFWVLIPFYSTLRQKLTKSLVCSPVQTSADFVQTACRPRPAHCSVVKLKQRNRAHLAPKDSHRHHKEKLSFFCIFCSSMFSSSQACGKICLPSRACRV